MRKMFKKITLMLLIVAITATVPIAFAAKPDIEERDVASVSPEIGGRQESNETSMETALIAIKSLIDIDDEVFSDFSYSSSFSNYETREGLIWSFDWSSASGASIYAAVTAEGVVLNYRKYDWEGKSFGFAEIDKKAAIAKADGFIRKAKPNSYTYYKDPVETYVEISNNEYYLTYQAMVDGYYFEAAQININVNKFSGEVTGYNAVRTDPGRFKFEDWAAVISESAAISAYAEKIGMSLEYRSYFDYENSSLKVFPVYIFNSYGDRYINAVSGDVATYVYDAGIDVGGGYNDSKMLADEEQAEAANVSGAGRASLSPAEIAAIDQASKFITGEEALRKLLAAIELTNLDMDSFAEQYISLNRDYIDKTRYYYNINMYNKTDRDSADDEISSVFGRVDAETGRVFAFSLYYNGYPQGGNNTMTEGQVEAAVEAFLKKIAPDEFEKVKKSSEEPTLAIPISKDGVYSYDFIRYENDTPFRDNRISVSFNSNTRKITSYTLVWYDSISFPAVSDVITTERALSSFVSQNGSKIKHITTGEGKASLVYDFSGQQYIDPFTGKALDYTGEPWEDSATIPEYGDVSGHWSEKYVMKLLDNGIFMWGGKFEPDKVMTELEFLQYIMMVDSYHYQITRAETQEYYARKGVEVEASPDKLLTRQEAARIISEYLGYGKLAEQSKWFLFPFSDFVADAYKGYVTICYMLGIVNGNAAGEFDAAGKVTRAHAAVMLHNLIISKS